MKYKEKPRRKPYEPTINAHRFELDKPLPEWVTKNADVTMCTNHTDGSRFLLINERSEADGPSYGESIGYDVVRVGEWIVEHPHLSYPMSMTDEEFRNEYVEAPETKT